MSNFDSRAMFCELLKEKDDETRLQYLESLMDYWGMRTILRLFAEIARRKAEHIRSNWQDRTTGGAWDRAAKRLDKVLPSIEV